MPAMKRIRPILLIVAMGLLLDFGFVEPSRASGPPVSQQVPVKTSRGEFPLLLFAPGKVAADKPLVLLISGEGGWRKFDDLLTGFLTDAGYWVGGIDITKYFWNPQDNRQELAADMRAHASAFAQAAGRKQDAPMVLLGFSFGADLAPWIAGAGGWDKSLSGLVMIGPDKTGSLQYRILEMLGFEPKEHIFQVADALASVSGVPVAFIHGGKDDGSAAPMLAEKTRDPKRFIVVPGADHHFSGAEQNLKTALLEALEWIAPPEKHE
jgi:type IV secretory pathway VirJ component